MRVQHNITALNAYRNFNTNNSMLGANLEKLSSGYKINRAGDNAAGLAISEKMRAQITGLDVAQRNAKDGISLVQTAEGALTEVHDMLNRMYELSEQSANGTFADEVDREQLQKEVDQLRTEINRIADSANFNGIRLLDGSLSSAGKAVDPSSTDAYVAPESEYMSDFDGVSFAKVSTTTSNAVNGSAPNTASGTKAEFTYKITETGGSDTLSGTFKIAGQDVTVGSTTLAALGSKTIDGVKIQDMFDISLDGGSNWKDEASEWDTTVVAAATAAQGADYEIVLKAKTKGELSQNTIDTMTATGGTLTTSGSGGVLTAENTEVGKNEGGITSATKAAYSATFTYANMQGGSTFSIGGKTFGISTTGGSIDGADVTIDLSSETLGSLISSTALPTNSEGFGETVVNTYDQAVAMQIRNAVNNSGLEDSYEVGSVDDVKNASGGTFTLTLTANEAGPASNSSNPYIGQANTADGVAITFTDGDPAKGGDPGKYTSLTYDNIDVTKLHVGDKLTINGAEVSVVADEDADWANGKLTEAQAHDAATMASAFQQVSTNANGTPKAGTGVNLDATDMTTIQGVTSTATAKLNLDFSGGKLTVSVDTKLAGTARDDDTHKDLYTAIAVKYSAASSTVNGAKQEIKDQAAAAKQYEIDAKAALAGKALTLQIGDTSDSFNQMEVEVNDMHTYNLGSKDADGNITGSLADVDISSQEGAAAACDILKDAINQVSDVRGTLGATQNRLEHTINNLGVMQENIQSAESVIRDTDVAEEMMKFTKNSIMNQAAQAMLAQANQLPQGVLQLLQ